MGFGWIAFRNCTDEQAKARAILSEVYKKNAAELATFKKEITRQRDAVCFLLIIIAEID